MAERLYVFTVGQTLFEQGSRFGIAFEHSFVRLVGHVEITFFVHALALKEAFQFGQQLSEKCGVFGRIARDVPAERLFTRAVFEDFYLRREFRAPLREEVGHFEIFYAAFPRER